MFGFRKYQVEEEEEVRRRKRGGRKGEERGYPMGSTMIIMCLMQD